MLNIREEIDILLLRRHSSLNKLSKEMREKGYDIPKNLPEAFNEKSIKFRVIQDILDYLGCQIVIKEK